MRDNHAMDTLFRDVADLTVIYRKGEYTLVVWGTRIYAEDVCETLEAFGLRVSYFADNDDTKVGSCLKGREIISADRVSRIAKPMVVIGSYWFQAIYEQMRQFGLTDVYALRDCFRYSYAEHLAERKLLAEYFDVYDVRLSDRVLVEVYGNIGDVIVKLGLMQAMLDRLGHENVWFICDDMYGGAAAEVIRLVSDHVIAIDQRKFSKDAEYRLRILRCLNGKYFKTSLGLCSIRLHAKRRGLNTLNFNVKRVILRDNSHFGTYTPRQDEYFVKEFLGLDRNTRLPLKGIVNAKLDELLFPYKLPEKYIALGLGASDPIRHYPHEKFATVANHMIKMGYTLMMLGFGQDDRAYYTKLIDGIHFKEMVIDWTDRLSITESLYVIKNAEFFVGVESALWNASYVLDKLSVVIYGGGDYGSFKHDEKNIQYVCLEDDKDCFNCFWDCKHKTLEGGAACISGITPQQIISMINKVIERRSAR